jgi:hypothetical protein
MKLSIIILSLTTLGIGTNLTAQMSGDHAFMIGDYVEIGINEAGYEGAPLDSTIATHYRGYSDKLGFIANPAEDDWVEYNGDFYQPGAPESGWGIGYTVGGVDYDLGNNAVGIFEIPGGITSYYSTVDSVIVIWQGMPASDSLLITLTYTLKKDEHFYRTSVQIDNVGSDSYTDVYYYRTLDPDNNMDILWGYGTQNSIESQSEMADDSVRVTAVQDEAWTSELIFEAYGHNWKGFAGGFYNRDASKMWNGYDTEILVSEGFSVFIDGAIGLALKIPVLGPSSKSESEVYSFTTAFKRGIVYEGEIDTDGITENGDISYKLYPNPTNGEELNLQIDGAFAYSIVDLKGSIVLTGQGSGYTQIDLASIEKGIYIIKIEQNNVRASEKLIIQ